MSETAGRCDVSFTVNGAAQTVSVYPMERLLDVLRNSLGLTGAEYTKPMLSLESCASPPTVSWKESSNA